MFSSETFAAANQFFNAWWWSQYTPGFLGKPEADGGWTFFVPGDPGKQYVRIWRGESVTIATCINMRAAVEPNNRVWMRDVQGVLTVEFADPLTSAALFGNNVGAAGVPYHVTAAGNDPVESQRLVPGHVGIAASGGLSVGVEGFWHPGGYFSAATLDLTGEGGSASGMSAWVVVYYDPADDALHAVTGDDVFGDPSMLSALDLTDIVLPSGVTPLGAVGLAFGQTDITGSSTFADHRIFLGSSSGSAPGDAKYIVQTPNSGLSAEQALSLLATGLMQVTTATGVVSSVTTSAGLAALISDETGSGALVFDTAPTLITPTFIAAVALVATFLNTGASGSGGGAFLNLYSDDGAAMASGDRLGGLGWGGAEDAAGTRAAAVAIAAFALEAWSASAHGSYVRAEYTPLGTTTRRAAWFAGLGKVLTDNTAIDLLSITRATNTSIGGVLRYSIMVFDGTDLQVETGEAFYSGYNKGGTRVGTITKVNAQQDLSAGTLTTTWAISNVAVPIISVNANSSLTPSAGYPLIRFTLDSFSGQAVALA